MKLAPITFAFLALAVAASAPAQVYPLSENSWSNPEFVQRFLGSYGFDTNITPSITTDEKAILEKVTPLIASNPAAAITELKGAITPETSAALLYTLANLYFQSNQLPEAEQAYKDAIKKFPNFLRSYKNLGVVYVQTGRFKDAQAMLLKTVELGGQGADVYGLLAYSYLNLGNSSAALSSYEQALLFDPESRDWRMGRVQCLMNLQRYDEAISMIDGLVQQFPKQKDLLLLEANAYIARGQPEDAAATLEILRASKAAPASALVLLGDIYVNLKQPELAIGIYKDALGTKDFGRDRMLRIARRLAAAFAWGELDEYLAALDKQSSGVLTDADQLEVLNLKAQSDLAQSRNEAASQKLETVVQKDPLNGKALLLLANYQWQKGDVERAEIYYERAAKIDVIAPDALLQHARMLVSLHKFSKAVPLLEKAQQLKPEPYVAQYLDKVSAAAHTAGT